MEVKLTTREREVIQRICELQINTLEDILTNSCEEDVPVYCLENEIIIADLNNSVMNDIATYEFLLGQPEFFLMLDSADMAIFKHILYRVIKRKDWKIAKKSIWRKIMIHEKLKFNPN